ncbi:hypothetical protein DPMN_181437 [Dreissena polymorpha]|uniref:Uncharacterized protein n=1 Tax=Dreissena polymorpha TaxID=45954 RepID=A0A9D4DDQ8_DREPO|nr:hypothetical protein DPMN_181437 [Dreissena polymorpha]
MGKPTRLGSGSNKPRPRDIYLKFATFRSRMKLLSQKSKLNICGYQGEYINDDQTRARSHLLYEARETKHVNSVLASDIVIIIRGMDMCIHRIVTMCDLHNLQLSTRAP